jgi:hypothetical protein
MLPNKSCTSAITMMPSRKEKRPASLTPGASIV